MLGFLVHASMVQPSLGIGTQCIRDVHGNGIPNGTGNPMGMGIEHRIGKGNGKPPQWEWELPALPWEIIPKGFMLR